MATPGRHATITLGLVNPVCWLEFNGVTPDGIGVRDYIHVVDLALGSGTSKRCRVLNNTPIAAP